MRKTSDGFFKDIIHPQAHKASALEHVINKLNIDQSDMIAIGDFYNDLEMIQFTGLGIAEDLKSKADEVTSQIMKLGSITSVLFHI
ncbi:HAD family hydrolase [Pseudalkalibacillus sp. A8]|uniref:HAD family hydrolase n=1 Tax=Pseudalkalibacillus sp. A8 TaxID=3382641 RepID=UPI0038B47C1F